MAFALFEVACRAEALAKAGPLRQHELSISVLVRRCKFKWTFGHPNPAIAGEGSLTRWL